MLTTRHVCIYTYVTYTYRHTCDTVILSINTVLTLTSMSPYLVSVNSEPDLDAASMLEVAVTLSEI